MNEGIYSYRNLDVWEQSQRLAVEVVKLMKSTRRDIVSVDIMKQLLRAAGSVPANIAEGHGRFTLPAYRNHLQIARGSASEIGSWLDLLCPCGYISAEEDARLTESASSVIRLLTVKIMAFNKRIESGAPRISGRRAFHPSEEEAA